VANWIRFSCADGAVGFGTLSEDGRRVMWHEGSPFGIDGTEPTGEELGIDEVTLLAPCQPGKIVALWNNFYALSKKLDKAPPKHPLFLIKPARSVIGTHEAIRRPVS
jgi:2-keto-4-pentenoate hydratase/2-oxohepta-3-ene-1,7-dioic acid hydratase in catechol pathway